MREYKRVEIEWIDSWGVNPSWESKEEALEHDVCKIITTGYLIKEDEETVWVAMSVDTNTGMFCGVMVIPERCIVKTKEDKS